MSRYSEYIALRQHAVVLGDAGDYEMAKGQTNPAIFDELVDRMFQADVLPVIWEPFAGHVGRSHSHDVCESCQMKLISYDIFPSDERVIRADSTRTGAGEPIGGMIFHPPYYGSCPLSKEKGEISLIEDREAYLDALRSVVKFSFEDMVKGGMVCVVCRRYRHGGEDIRLDEWFLDIFQEAGFILVEVWSSEPDIILVMEKP